MSIRPIDYVNIISKSQEITKIKQEQNSRLKIQMEQNVNQQDKRIMKNIKKVRNTNKTENLTIDTDKERENPKQKNEKKQDKEKKKDKEGIGNSIDIKI